MLQSIKSGSRYQTYERAYVKSMKNMATSRKFAIVSGYLGFLSSLSGGDGVPRSFVADLTAFYRVNSTVSID